MESVSNPEIQNQSTQPQQGSGSNISPEMQSNKHLLRSFSENKTSGSSKNPVVIFLGLVLAVVAAGTLTGWAIAQVGNNPQSNVSQKTAESGDNGTKTEAGIGDESMFEEDTPEGMLVEGGLDGEGTHHLDRNAGPEKKVYLTSSVINLDNFVGKKVRVWGNTIAAQNAPWLMDVGKIKVIQ